MYRFILVAAVLGMAVAAPLHAQETALWGDGKPVCVEPKYETAPAVVPDGTGGAIIVWTDFRNGTFDWIRGWADGDIYAQRIDADGNTLWEAGGVPICTAAGEQYGVRAISDGAGGAIIAWTDVRGGMGWTFGDIYAQRIDSSGTALWTTNGVPVCTAPSLQNGLAMVSDGTGGAVLTWYDMRSATWDAVKMTWVNSDIYAQRINASGQPQWTLNGVVVCNSPLDQYGPVLIGQDGGAVIAWFDYRSATWDSQKNTYVNTDIYVQKLSAAGAAQWTANGVPVCTVQRDQYSPAIASDGAGGAIIAWIDCRVAQTDQNIYAQRVNSIGAPQWAADGIPICTEDYEQYLSAVVPDGAGGAFIIWEDYRLDAYGDIYMQRVDGSGSLWSSELVVASYAAEWGVVAAPDGSGNVILAYHSWNSATGTDILAQKVSRTGQKLWSYLGEVVCNQAANQQNPAFCIGPSGVIFTWDDDRANDPNGAWWVADIYAQRFGLPATYESISEVRLLPDGAACTLSNKVVSAKFPSMSYIQDVDRTAGIKVLETTWAVPQEGRLVGLTAKIRTVDGERQLEPIASVADLGSGTLPKPLGIGARSLGGSPVETGGEVRVPGVAGGIGTNNVGLLVKVWGRVSYIADWLDPDWPYFYIDDGSGLVDASGNLGIRVFGDAEFYGLGAYLAVTGVSSTWLPSGEAIAARAVRPTIVRAFP